MKPKDQELYDKTKKEVYKRIPKHSAYRSGVLVQTYKKNLLKNMEPRNLHIVGKKQKKKV